MLTGQLPFRFDGKRPWRKPPQVIREEEPTDMRLLSEGSSQTSFKRVISLLLEKDPDERFQSVESLANRPRIDARRP